MCWRYPCQQGLPDLAVSRCADADTRRKATRVTTTFPAPTVTLNNGVRMAIIGFGVFEIPPEQTQQVVEQALAAGYRHLDTAASYGDEEAVGAAIGACGMPRDELFVTTSCGSRHVRVRT
jgi:predicted RecA/RadA family phage recombinase